MANKKSEYAHFSDVHDKMVQVTTGLITREQFTNWFNENITVKSYLPLASKYAIVNVFAETFKNKAFNQGDNKKIDLDYIYLEYDLSMMFDLQFYYTNIGVMPTDKTTKNYDLVKQSGLYDLINGACEGDYVELLEKCDRLSGIRNVSIMNELINIFDNYPKVEEIERMRDILNNEVDIDKLNVLKTIETFNNPTLTKIVEGIKSESTDEILTKKE